MASSRDGIDPVEPVEPESPRFASIVSSENTRQSRGGGHTWRSYGLFLFWILYQLID